MRHRRLTRPRTGIVTSTLPERTPAALPLQSPASVYRSNPPIEPRNGIGLPATPAPAEAPVPPMAPARSVRAGRIAVQGPAAAVPLVPQSIFPSVPDQQNPVVTHGRRAPGSEHGSSGEQNHGSLHQPCRGSFAPGLRPASVPRSPAGQICNPSARSPARIRGRRSRQSCRIRPPIVRRWPNRHSWRTWFRLPNPRRKLAPQARAVPAPRQLSRPLRWLRKFHRPRSRPRINHRTPPHRRNQSPLALCRRTRRLPRNIPKKRRPRQQLRVLPPAEPAVRNRPQAQPLTAPEARSSSRTPESPQGTNLSRGEGAGGSPVPEPVSAPAGSKNIEMHFTVDEGRVQVHVAERAGEVRVAVHTPDANLAGTLREELPQLTSRLEQSGFHAETWHGPTAGPAEGMRAGEPAPGSPQQDTPDPQQRNSGGQQNEEQQRRQPPEEQAAARPRSEDFSWLFDAVRIND